MKPLKNYRETTAGKPIPADNNQLLKIQSDGERFLHFRIDELFFIQYEPASLSSTNSVHICTSGEGGFYLLYCENGELEITLSDGKSRTVEAFNSTIVYDSDADGVRVKVKDGTAARFSVAGCNKPGITSPEHGSCFRRYKEKFLELMPSNCRIYTGQPNLQLSDKFKTLTELTDDTVVSQFEMHACIYEAFALKLKQMLELIERGWVDYGTLTMRDRETIDAVVEYIRANPSREYTIEMLCRRTGLSPAKLQEGFKKMVGCTVINFIRDMRLQKATELMHSTEMNISEIVYSIGLTSRSYFSKIFKLKYNCSPKFFQEQLRSFAGMP